MNSDFVECVAEVKLVTRVRRRDEDKRANDDSFLEQGTDSSLCIRGGAWCKERLKNVGHMCMDASPMRLQTLMSRFLPLLAYHRRANLNLHTSLTP